MAETRNTRFQSSELGELDEDAALRSILEGTSSETGERFFFALVENLAKALKTHGAWITEYFPEQRRLRALAFWMDGQWVHNYETDLAGTPCEQVIGTANLVHFPDKLLELFPDDRDVTDIGAVSYIGIPLKDIDSRILGHLAVIDRRPMPAAPRVLAIFKIFADRATAEMRRLRAEKQVREREEKLRALFDSVMDGVIELDANLKVTRMNPAAEKAFRCTAEGAVGQDFSRLISAASRQKFQTLLRDLNAAPEYHHSLWIPAGLEALRLDGAEFPAEATLSRFDVDGQRFYCLILRNIYERIEADRKIHSLAAEAAYLREEIKNLRGFDEILGQSATLKRVLEDIEQVAATDATVLIFGETGTGKELVARAIHSASGRRDKPLITINCAAVPASLMESEFFGHEKGAFTGALRSTKGLFTQADGGTLFLDEIGDMPLATQSKLLRALQERQFYPVGGDSPVAVDVRVIVATNKDLQELVQKGLFRDDLYYRIHVIPILLPPLRERKEDIVPLVDQFLKKFSQQMKKDVKGITPEVLKMLMLHDWPGNVRELENAIEYAVAMTQKDLITEECVLQPKSSTGSDTAKGLSHQRYLNGDETLRPLKDARDAFEKDYLVQVLSMTEGNVTQAAKLAGKYRADLYDLLKKHDLTVESFKKAKSGELGSAD
jgi:PAS domain S-box-containing protein